MNNMEFKNMREYSHNEFVELVKKLNEQELLKLSTKKSHAVLTNPVPAVAWLTIWAPQQTQPQQSQTERLTCFKMQVLLTQDFLPAGRLSMQVKTH